MSLKEVQVVLEDERMLGLEYSFRQGMVVVDKVTPQSPADKAGLQCMTPFVVRRAGGAVVSDPSCLVEAVGRARADSTHLNLAVCSWQRKDLPPELSLAALERVEVSSEGGGRGAAKTRGPSGSGQGVSTSAEGLSDASSEGIVVVPHAGSGADDSFTELSPLPHAAGSPVQSFTKDGVVGEEEWAAAHDSEGILRVSAWERMQRRVFEHGCEDCIRAEVWGLLLGLYNAGCTTAAEREEGVRRAEFEGYLRQWEMVTDAQRRRWASFVANEDQVLRDVTRTDRASPLFNDEHGEGVKALRELLVAHLIYNHDQGYCQGMSDVAALLLAVFQHTPTAFWAFAAVLEGKMHLGKAFGSDLAGARKQLGIVAQMLDELDPPLCRRLRHLDPAFLFIFRWVALRFKREFHRQDVLRVWDACLACPTSPDFHLLIVCAALRQPRLRGALLAAETSDELAALCGGGRLRSLVDPHNVVQVAVRMFREHARQG
eukprot:Hpha_TRINITY_DN16078_c3_g3::TRINITY_DN16078_c3_g3_i3::g.117709::m.117709/K20168/TBC1D15; TBC1 domain family member 15